MNYYYTGCATYNEVFKPTMGRQGSLAVLCRPKALELPRVNERKGKVNVVFVSGRTKASCLVYYLENRLTYA